MIIKTNALKHYKTVDVIVEDGGAKIEERFYENEMLALKEMFEKALDDVNYILEEIKNSNNGK